MNRKDIETFAAIQNHLYEYCKNVLTTLAKDYPECGISDIARVVGVDVIDKYLQITYWATPVTFLYTSPSSTSRPRMWMASARHLLRR